MLKLDERGLIPTICQDINTGKVLMLGYMNPGSLKRTLEVGQVWFYSRSRDGLWHKGETSGNFMNVKGAYVDCDTDTLLLQVVPDGPACHTGNTSCFFAPLEEDPQYVREEQGPGILQELFGVIKERQRDKPRESYTAQLLGKGTARIAQKIIEEAGEAALAATQGQTQELIEEVADLLYHTLVLVADSGLRFEDVWKELRARRR